LLVNLHPDLLHKNKERIVCCGMVFVKYAS